MMGMLRGRAARTHRARRELRHAYARTMRVVQMTPANAHLDGVGARVDERRGGLGGGPTLAGDERQVGPALAASRTASMNALAGAGAPCR